MSLAGISFAYLKARRLSTILNVLLLALAVAAITLLLLAAEQIEERMDRDARGIDLVIGAKGSALQIILSSVYQLDVPTGTIAWSDAQQIALKPEVKKAIPIALAGNYRGYRIVGTSPDYLAHYDAVFREGALWQAPFEAVIGADVARRSGLKVGSTLIAAHGTGNRSDQVHGEPSYRVAGVLAPTATALDHLILVEVASVWTLHRIEPVQGALVAEPRTDEGREITALLVQYASSLAGVTLQREVNASPHLQAASPTFETERLFSVMAVGMQVLRAFSVVLVLAAGLSVFIALYGALNERRHDLAIMRALGASPAQLMALLLFEGLLLAALGAAVGLLLGHLLTSMLGLVMRLQQVGVTGWTFNFDEVWIAAGALVVGVLAALLPAWWAHETDIAGTLSRG